MASKLAGFAYRPARPMGRPIEPASTPALPKAKADPEAPSAAQNAEKLGPDTTAPVVSSPETAILAKVEFRGALKRAVLSLAAFAKLTGTPLRTVEDWARPKGSMPIPLAVSMARVLAESADAKSILEKGRPPKA